MYDIKRNNVIHTKLIVRQIIRTYINYKFLYFQTTQTEKDHNMGTEQIDYDAPTPILSVLSSREPIVILT